MGYAYDYEEELREKEREIGKLENDLEACQNEIRRLRNVCREYENLLDQLPIQRLLQVFDQHGWKESYSVGRWSIANGGYDLWFQVYQDGIAKIECVDGEVSLCSAGDEELEQVINCILETFQHLRRAENGEEADK